MSTTNLQPTPLGAVFGMPPDGTIYLLHARIKKVFARKTGKYKQGARTGETWSLQNVELQAGEAEMTMVLKDRDEELSKSWEGRQIRVEAWKGDKGWSGVYAFDDEYQGKITRKIKVTPTGNLSLLDGDGNPEQEREPEPPA